MHTVPKLHDLRTRFASGETISIEEYREVLRAQAAHRQAAVEKADAKSRAKHVDLNEVFKS